MSLNRLRVQKKGKKRPKSSNLWALLQRLLGFARPDVILCLFHGYFKTQKNTKLSAEGSALSKFLKRIGTTPNQADAGCLAAKRSGITSWTSKVGAHHVAKLFDFYHKLSSCLARRIDMNTLIYVLRDALGTWKCYSMDDAMTRWYMNIVQYRCFRVKRGTCPNRSCYFTPFLPKAERRTEPQAGLMYFGQRKKVTKLKVKKLHWATTGKLSHA